MITRVQINGKTRKYVDKSAVNIIADVFSSVVGRKIKRVIWVNDKTVNIVTDDD